MSHSILNSPIRNDWLATQNEEILWPDQLIIDSHHHLYGRPGATYLFDDYLSDLRTGHNIIATVFVQARSNYHLELPEAMQPVGETAFAASTADRFAGHRFGDIRMCAGIVGYADLLLGDAVRPVLEAHLAAIATATKQRSRFCGIRHIAAWDPDPAMLNPAYPTTKTMLLESAFREGFAHLEPLGMSFDAWIYYHQIPYLTSLADEFPSVPIALNHCGGVLGIGRYAGRRDELFATWKTALQELAARPNVTLKISGLGMRLSGFGFENHSSAPSSIELARAWRPWVVTCIETFGTERCMFGSNFPVDKGSCSYPVAWNAFKRLATDFSVDERNNLFWRNAARFYKLPLGN